MVKIDWFGALRQRMERLGENTRHLLEGASVAFVLKVIAAGAGFVFSVALSRTLGAAGVGLFFLAASVVQIATLLGRIGLDDAVVRFAATSHASGDWAAVRGLRRLALRLVLLGAAAVTVLVAVSVPWLADEGFDEPALRPVLWWMCLAVVPTALAMLHAQLLKGLRRLSDALLLMGVLRPVLSLVLVVGPALRWGVNGAAAGFTAVGFLLMLDGMRRWYKAVPPGETVRFGNRRLLTVSLPLFIAASLHLFSTWASTIILGFWADSADVGIFNAANRLAMLVSLILVAFNAIAAPLFARLHTQQDRAGLAHAARLTCLLGAALASPIVLLYFLFPAFWMSLFGPEFTQGGNVLMILAGGQFVNVATGSVGYLLIMTGRERVIQRIALFCAVLSVGLNLWLIPLWGITGAAWATAAVLSINNLIALVVSRHELGFTFRPPSHE